jgi:hypothetical protein
MELINKLIKVFIVFQSLVLLSCTVGDEIPPSQLNDPLESSTIKYISESRIINFITSGDDNFSGTATVFDLRYMDEFQIEDLTSSSIDDLSFLQIQQTVMENFSKAVQIQGEQSPDKGRTEQNVVFTRVEPSGNIRYFLSLNIRDEVGNNSGPSNVVEGSTSYISTIFEDLSVESCFGASVSSGNLIEETDDRGNVFVDGEDIIIGDPCRDTVYIFRGNSTIGNSDSNGDGIYELPAPDSAEIIIVGFPGTMFGASVAALGNIGGGKLDEIVIGAPGFNSNTGQIIVIFDENDETFPEFMDLNLGFIPDLVINGEQVGDNFGIEMITASNIISASNDNIIAGAPSALSNRGRAYLFKQNLLQNNSILNASEATAIFSGEDDGDLFGTDISLAGIIDNDSRSDIAITAPAAAKVYIIFGDSDIDSIDLSVDTSDVSIISGNVADEFAFSVSGDGDLDGDPDKTSKNDVRDDIIIGAPGFAGGAGKVFVYSGFDIEDVEGTGINPPTSHEITGLIPEGRFGEALSFLGDMNPVVEVKDRFGGNILFLDEPTSDDIAIGAPEAGNGVVYIFFGNENLPATLDTMDFNLIFEGSESANGYGSIIENLNDVNSDFLPDFGVGEENKINLLF